MASDVLTPVLELEEKLASAKKAAIKELLSRRKAIDDELKALGHTDQKILEFKTVTCGICNQPGHNSRSCPQAKKKADV